MAYLPRLKVQADGSLALDHTSQIAAFLLDLAEQYAEDETVGAALNEIADLRRKATAERHLDGLGHAEHALDRKALLLIESLGHGEAPLADRASCSVVQARQIDREARQIAEAATAYADRVARTLPKAA